MALEADAAALLATDGYKGVRDPLSVIEQACAQAVARAEAAGERVNALTEVRYQSTMGTEQLRSEIGIMERAQAEAVKYAELLIKYRPDSEANQTRSLMADLADRLDRARTD